VDIINPGKVKFELRDADLILNKRFLPVLGRSLVFMIAIGSGYETVLKDLTQFFFKNFIFIFSRPRQGFKNLQKIILPGFQSVDSPTCDTNRFSKPVFAYQLLQILLSQK